MASRVDTFRPPPDSPKIVTAPGSPPNLCDVVAHPFERGNDVEQPDVTRRGELVPGKTCEMQRPEDVQAVVDRNDDDVGAAAGINAVVGRRRPRTRREYATVQSDHDRPLTTIPEPRGRHVEKQTVLVRRRLGSCLRRARTVVERILRARPEMPKRRQEAATATPVAAS